MTLFRNLAVSLMMVLIAQSAWARESFGLVSVGYGNPANISADLDLEEINPDQYPEYDLDPGRVWMARKAYSTVVWRWVSYFTKRCHWVLMAHCRLPDILRKPWHRRSYLQLH